MVLRTCFSDWHTFLIWVKSNFLCSSYIQKQKQQINSLIDSRSASTTLKGAYWKRSFQFLINQFIDFKMNIHRYSCVCKLNIKLNGLYIAPWSCCRNHPHLPFQQSSTIPLRTSLKQRDDAITSRSKSTGKHWQHGLRKQDGLRNEEFPPNLVEFI